MFYINRSKMETPCSTGTSKDMPMATSFPRLLPRQTVPELHVPVVGGRSYDIRMETPATFSLIVFYRGLHCQICKTQLKDIETRLGEFERRGVSVVAISE